MIGDIAHFLKTKLSTYLDKSLEDAGASEDQVVFISGDKTDPLQFKLGSVSMMLINVEEDNTLRDANPYISRDSQGNAFRVQSTIRLNIFVLFVSRFRDYRQSLNCLSQVIQYFQKERVFKGEDEPGLPDDVEKLVLEMITLPFSQQNEVWSALRTTYLPSVMYKVKILAFRAVREVPVPIVETTKITVTEQS